jgi:hypothetical protein
LGSCAAAGIGSRLTVLDLCFSFSFSFSACFLASSLISLAVFHVLDKNPVTYCPASV